jgi:hypothetical protein
MKNVTPLADHLAPDTISQLERAAELRYDDGVLLLDEKRELCAAYPFGYSAEMCLAAAYFRAIGFPTTNVTAPQMEEIVKSSAWFLEQRGRL